MPTDFFFAVMWTPPAARWDNVVFMVARVDVDGLRGDGAGDDDDGDGDGDDDADDGGINVLGRDDAGVRNCGGRGGGGDDDRCAGVVVENLDFMLLL